MSMTHKEVDALEKGINNARNAVDALCRSICDKRGEDASSIWGRLRDISVALGDVSHDTFRLRPEVGSWLDVVDELEKFTSKDDCRRIMKKPIVMADDGCIVASDGRVAFFKPCEIRKVKKMKHDDMMVSDYSVSFGKRIVALMCGDDVANRVLPIDVVRLFDIAKTCYDEKLEALKKRGYQRKWSSIRDGGDDEASDLMTYEEEAEQLAFIAIVNAGGVFSAKYLRDIADAFMYLGGVDVGGGEIHYGITGFDNGILNLNYKDMRAATMKYRWKGVLEEVDGVTVHGLDGEEIATSSVSRLIGE